MIVSTLFFLKFNIAGLYKDLKLDCIELVIYMNIMILSIVKLYILSADEEVYEYTHEVLAYISVYITLVLVTIVILFFHIFTEVICKTDVWKVVSAWLKVRRDQRPVITGDNINLSAQVESGVTTTVLDGCPPIQEQCNSKGKRKIVKNKELPEIIEPRLSSHDDYV